MKNMRMVLISMFLVSMLSVVGVVIAANCDPPVSVDPGTLPFPVDVEQIQHRLLGGVVTMSDKAMNQPLGACDPDDDPVVFTATEMPVGMTLDVVDGVSSLNWTPTAAQIGTYYVNIKVEDRPNENPNQPYPPNEPSLSDEGTIVFRVYKTNSAPILLAL
jgi:hypothetical protein